jgi:transposase
MKLTREQRKKIINLFPKQRGNVTVDNSRFLDAIIYVRINRWAKNGVLERIFKALQEEQITNKRIRVVSLDSRSVKVHPDAAGAVKKTETRPWGSPVGG